MRNLSGIKLMIEYYTTNSVRTRGDPDPEVETVVDEDAISIIKTQVSLLSTDFQKRFR